MTDLIQLTKENDIAVITINNPPVNALSPGVPEGISEALDQIAQDADIKAVVLVGGGRTFIAGADIKEFGKMTSGNPIKATEALQFGVVDRIIEGDLLSGAIAFAREIASQPAPKTRERNEKLGNAAANAPIFSAARETVAKKQRGLLAPAAAITPIKAATP